MAINPLTIRPQNKTPYEMLPEGIKAHLNSRETVEALFVIEKKLNITSEQVEILPVIITELVTGELDPLQAQTDIQGSLKTSAENALLALTWIKEKIINPIALPLKNITGVDLSALPGQAPTQATSKIVKTEEEEAEFDPNYKPQGASEEAIIVEPQKASPSPVVDPALQPRVSDVRRPQTLATASQPLTKQTPVVATEPIEIEVEQNPTVATGVRPFMLHEERPASPNQASTRAPIKESFAFAQPSATPATKLEPKPTPASFNSSFDQPLAPKPTTQPAPVKTGGDIIPRIVHYTAFKTPLDEKGNPRVNQPAPATLPTPPTAPTKSQNI